MVVRDLSNLPKRPGGARRLAALLALLALTSCAPTVPANDPIREARWLDQNWSDDERFWYHHTSQGTATLPIPYSWFVALEQPTLRLFGDSPLMKDEDYLRRFGFIPSPKEIDGEQARAYGYRGKRRGFVPKLAAHDDAARNGANPDGLPVGFARLRSGDGAENPDRLGFTCAACHTGHLEVNGIDVRIDGAPAVADLGKFTDALHLAIAYTQRVPGRFARFADRVLGPAHSANAEAELERALDERISRGRQLRDLTEEVRERDACQGPGRLDALTRIGNQIFFEGLLASFDPEDSANALALANLRPLVAPVNFPAIWDAPWFEWVQYDASIRQPMVRNAGQALGVRAQIDLRSGPGLYSSSVALAEIFELESLLAGDNPHAAPIGFKGLMSPRWPADVLGPIDEESRVRGERTYQEICVGCHGPPVSSQEFWERGWTEANPAHERYLVMRTRHVGTDPIRATLLRDRSIRLPEYLGVDPGRLCGGTDGRVVTEASFGVALASVVEKTTNRWYDDHGVAAADRERMNGHRPNCVRTEDGYKSRPLNGVWATAPFLHNGSVPNLYELFSPLNERSESFYVGSRHFDPVKVGYETAKVKGASLFDTTQPGNSNAGHEFRDRPGPGRVGPELSPDQRFGLIEYLKSLEPTLASGGRDGAER